MPNYCYYKMKLKGKKSDMDEFVGRMKNYDLPNHFWRIFEATTYPGETENTMYVEGDCAWSIESCCRASGYSEGVDLFEVNTYELDLSMEVYSSETGMGFEEHYIYKNGICLSDECLDTTEYWWDKLEFETFEEFKKDLNLPENVREEDLDDNGWIKIGGFESWDWHI